MAGKLTGAEKAAILLLALGDEVAPQILKNFNDKEIRKIGQLTAKMGDIDPETVSSVLKEFIEDAQQAGKAIMGSEDFLKKAVSNALGGDKANALLGDIYATSHALEFLNTVDPKITKNIVIKEQPQTIALILAYMQPDRASQVLAILPEDMRADVVLRMSHLDPVSPEILQDIEEVLEEEIKAIGALSSENVGGLEQVAEMFNQMDKSSMTEILTEIEELNPELADNIRSLMFVFEDLLNVDDRGIQTILKEVNNETLILALKGASDELKAKIFKNVSSRAAEMLKDDLETMGPVKLSDVEAAQGEIVRTAMRLEEEGKIVLAGAGDELI